MKEDLLTTSVALGINVCDDTLNTVRNMLGVDGITVSLVDNGSSAISGSGGGGSIPASIAEFTEAVTKHHKLIESCR